MSYTYASFQSALAELMVTTTSDSDFVAIVPSIIDYAEQRLYRELDLLATVVPQTLTATALARTLSLSGASQYIVTVQDVNIITPVTVTNADLGTRNQCERASKEYLDAVWNSATGAAIPRVYALRDNQTVLFGPWPDQAYSVEVVGTIRPLPLYNAAESGGTFLSLYLPDLFMAAAMIFASGYQKNFGSQSDDPRMAQSWETQYQALFASANAEEIRKKFALAPTPAPAKVG